METKEYSYTEKSREISGFGGGYERTCREMVIRGMKWFDENPEASPNFEEYEDVYGIINPKNHEAKSLIHTMTDGVDATGAMVQACVGHVRYAKTHGWDKYIQEMEKGD